MTNPSNSASDTGPMLVLASTVIMSSTFLLDPMLGWVGSRLALDRHNLWFREWVMTRTDISICKEILQGSKSIRKISRDKANVRMPYVRPKNLLALARALSWAHAPLRRTPSTTLSLPIRARKMQTQTPVKSSRQLLTESIQMFKCNPQHLLEPQDNLSKCHRLLMWWTTYRWHSVLRDKDLRPTTMAGVIASQLKIYRQPLKCKHRPIQTIRYPFVGIQASTHCAVNLSLYPHSQEVSNTQGSTRESHLNRWPWIKRQVQAYTNQLWSLTPSQTKKRLAGIHLDQG